MMRASPTSSMQKTYDECFLTCSTAVYFESQNNEAEALRSWKTALSQIYYHNAHRMPPNYRPQSETEKALHHSIHQLELQCKERVDLLEALKQSRNDAASANPDPAAASSASLPDKSPQGRSTSAHSLPVQSGWLGGGTVPPVDYPDLFRPPPLPHRPSIQQRTSSGAESNHSRRSKQPISRNSLSPDPILSLGKSSRTPSPEKKGMLKTLRSRGDGPRSSTSKFPASMRPRPPDAAKAATQAWGINATSRQASSLPHLSQVDSTQETTTKLPRVAIRASSERRASENIAQPLSLSTSSGEASERAFETRPQRNMRVGSSSTPRSPTPKEDRFQGLIKKLPNGIDPSAAEQIIKEIVVHGDEVHWDDIAGLDIAKSALKETVVYPFLRPDLFMGLREPAKGMLLFGPPGTGKTMLARAVATESKSTFFAISASSLTSKFLGESEKLVRALFGLAKMLAPSIIFVDEIDSLLSARSGSGEHEATRRIKTEFLIQWSDLAKAAAGREQQDKERGDASRVLVLAATNLPWAIDEAARRRFVRRQYIPLPEDLVRKRQLQTLLSHHKHSLSDQEIDSLAQSTEGFSGSDITALAKDAAMGPLRSLGERLLHMTMDEIRPIQYSDFEASLGTIRPSVSRHGLKQYEDWAKEFGERGG